MKLVLAVLVSLVLASSTCLAGGPYGCGYYYTPSYCYNSCYTPSYCYSYYCAGVYGGRWYPAGNYALIGGCWYRQGYGYEYGIPIQQYVVQSALVAPYGVLQPAGITVQANALPLQTVQATQVAAVQQQYAVQQPQMQQQVGYSQQPMNSNTRARG